MSYESHQRRAADRRAAVAVVTLSDTRTLDTDTSGKAIVALLNEAGHDVIDTRLIPDDPEALGDLLNHWIADENIDTILSNGGTGISRRDHTIDVFDRAIDTPLPGFGELFRVLSFEQIGSGAMLSRAVGGIARGTLLFAMPGSTKAVELAMWRLILPELRHLLEELRK